MVDSELAAGLCAEGPRCVVGGGGYSHWQEARGEGGGEWVKTVENCAKLGVSRGG